MMFEASIEGAKLVRAEPYVSGFLNFTYEHDLCTVYAQSFLEIVIYHAPLNRGNIQNEARSWLPLMESYSGPK